MPWLHTAVSVNGQKSNWDWSGHADGGCSWEMTSLLTVSITNRTWHFSKTSKDQSMTWPLLGE